MLRAVAAAEPPPAGLSGPLPTLWVYAETACLLSEEGRRLAEWDCAELLARYHQAGHEWRVAPRYLMTLTQAWLGDLAHGWLDTPPPGAAAFAALGLLERLAGGIVEPVSG